MTAKNTKSTKIRSAEKWPGDKPTGKTRTFTVTVSKTVDVTLDESILAQGLLPDNPIFGSRLSGEKEFDESIVVEHLAFNLVCNGLELDQIDGYSNCPSESAKVSQEDWEIVMDCEIWVR